MLANDSVTLAVAVPIWLTRPDIAVLERHNGIRHLPEGAPADQTSRTRTGVGDGDPSIEPEQAA